MNNEQNDKLVIMIPSSSKNCNYKTLNDCLLINTLYKCIKNFDISKYTFIIGFDDDDVFYLNNKENLEKVLADNFHLYYLDNNEKSYVCIVNQLANIAIDTYDADYLFLMADDLEFTHLNFIQTFIDNLKDKNVGLAHALDKTNNAGICTHPFVKSSHVKYLGYFYPKEIKNWYCDDWITRLYNKLKIVFKTEEFVLSNKVFQKRYKPYRINDKQLEQLVTTAENILKNKI
jgi:hypothetical protein